MGSTSKTAPLSAVNGGFQNNSLISTVAAMLTLASAEPEPSHPLGSVGTYNYDGGNVKISGYYSPQAFGYGVHVPNSYQYISQGGLRYLHKREAEPSHPLGSVGTYNYEGGNVKISGYYSPQAYGYSVQEGHPGYVLPYQYVSLGGVRYLHKREAEPSHPLGSVGTYNYEGGNVKISGYYSPQAFGYSVHVPHSYQFISQGAP